MSIFNSSGKQYLRCTKRLDNKSCAGCGKIITSELEAVVYQQMVKKLASYKTLTGRKKAAKANQKIAALQVELAHVDSEIEKLVDSLTGATPVRYLPCVVPCKLYFSTLSTGFHAVLYSFFTSAAYLFAFQSNTSILCIFCCILSMMNLKENLPPPHVKHGRY